jgi:hypothetical protein
MSSGTLLLGASFYTYGVKLATEPHHQYYGVVFHFTHHSRYDLMIKAA